MEVPEAINISLRLKRKVQPYSMVAIDNILMNGL